MAFDRSKIVQYAKDYWWRPCKDGVVWAKNGSITISQIALTKKLPNYDGAFLWYRGTKSPTTEGLFLVPRSQIDVTMSNKSQSDFPDAVMICSYEDNPGDEPDDIKKQKLPYYGLNDCTHFTTECLAFGGFPVTVWHARVGAPQFHEYLTSHKDTKVLASDVSQDVAATVISAGLLKGGDVIVYGEGGKRNHHHHGVVYIDEGGKILMHTWHQKVDWQDAGGDNQTYSLFHLSVDDDFATAAGRWVGWWQITQGAEVRYYYFSKNGHVFSQKQKPTSTKETPKGADYWFPDDKNQNRVRVCIRGKGIVETYTIAPGASAGAPVSGGQQNGIGGLILGALKLE